MLAALSYPREARLMPLLIGVPTLVMCILVLVGEKYPVLLRRLDVSIMEFSKESIDASKEASKEREERRQEVRKLLGILGWIGAFFAAIYLVGFLIGVPLFVLAFLSIYARSGWRTSLVIVAGTWVFV